MKNLKGKKILFATVPADGHFNPLTGLAKYLQQLGCDVRWYTSKIYKNKLDKLSIEHYIFKHALDINATNVDEILPERKLITDALEKLNYDLINLMGDRSIGYYSDIKDIYESFPFDLMIVDSLFSGAPIVKAMLNIPVIAIGIIPLAEDSTDLAPYGMALSPAADEIQRIDYAELRDTAINVLFKPSINAYDAILKENGISAERSILFNLLIKQADLYLQIGSQGFEYKRSDLGENVRFVGALLPYSFKTEKQGWYDERIKKYTKIILVTQGTVEKETHKIIEPTLKAYINTDTLVIATTGGNDTQELREKYIANNLIIEDYIPFEEVMPFATVYVTNGGYSGTLLAIKNKLLIVAAGIHEGKNEVCARIGYFKYGINLHTETPTPIAIRDAVEEVISNKEYQNNITGLFKELTELAPYELSAHYIQEFLNKPVITAS